MKKVKIIAMVLCCLTLATVFRSLLVISLLIVVGACSTYYKRYVNIGFDFELCSFGAIVAGVVYGPGYGFLVGFLSMMIGLILNLLFFKNIFFALLKSLAIAVIGLLAAFVPLTVLVPYSACMVLFTDVVFCSIAAVAGGNKGKLAMVALTHTMMVYVFARSFLEPAIAVVR